VRAREGLLRPLAEGLYYWTLPHPTWDPVADDLSAEYRAVGSVLHLATDATVIIDPIAPHPSSSEAAVFWRELDELVTGRGHPAVVLLTVFWHERDVEDFVTRYEVVPWADEDSLPRLEFQPARPVRPERELPGGIRAFATAREGEMVFWLPAARALVTGDVLIGDGRGGIRLCPADWMALSAGGLGALRDSLLPLLELPVELIVPAHGAPVLQGSKASLAVALAA
jgi:glyoxylase-like metal-dependent hydrolase (beta-lactamase superfamily II)